MVLWNEAIGCGRASNLGCVPGRRKLSKVNLEHIHKRVLFEVLREGFFVQKDPRVLKLFVEPVLHLLHTCQDAGKVTVPSENNKGRSGFAVGGWDGGVMVIFSRYCLVQRPRAFA